MLVVMLVALLVTPALLLEMLAVLVVTDVLRAVILTVLVLDAVEKDPKSLTTFLMHFAGDHTV